MTLQQLIYVTTIANYSSINKAAQELYLTQSSLSVSVQKLEKELGFPIFQRTNHGITTTPEGEEFLDNARQIVNQYRTVEEKFVFRKESKKNFSVSAQHYTFAVKAFIEVAKKLALDQYALGIYECKTAEIIQNVKNYKSEIGILYMDDFNREVLTKILEDANVIFHKLFSCRTYVFLSSKHPLVGKEKITLEELQPYPCLSFDQGSEQTFYLAEEVYSTKHYHQVIKGSDRATLLNLMTGLNGYTLCSGIICEDLNGPGYTVVPLDSKKIMDIGYICRKGEKLSKLGVAYVEEMMKFNQRGETL